MVRFVLINVFAIFVFAIFLVCVFALRDAEAAGLTVDHSPGDYQPRAQCYKEPKITRLTEL